MEWNFMFFLNSILLGIGLAMDAFSVSLANGLNEPKMSRKKEQAIALAFALFQALMPLIGWIFVCIFLSFFDKFTLFIPWIALALLGYIGGKMLYDGCRPDSDENVKSDKKLTLPVLFMQAVATSIDALSVGFTIAEYDLPMALVASFIIAAVTYAICLVGTLIGKKFGTALAGKASILGGIILIVIGIEIFLKGILG